jgi:hypothetical protein
VLQVKRKMADSDLESKSEPSFFVYARRLGTSYLCLRAVGKQRPIAKMFKPKNLIWNVLNDCRNASAFYCKFYNCKFFLHGSQKSKIKGLLISMPVKEVLPQQLSNILNSCNYPFNLMIGEGFNLGQTLLNKIPRN